MDARHPVTSNRTVARRLAQQVVVGQVGRRILNREITMAFTNTTMAKHAIPTDSLRSLLLRFIEKPPPRHAQLYKLLESLSVRSGAQSNILPAARSGLGTNPAGGRHNHGIQSQSKGTSTALPSILLVDTNPVAPSDDPTTDTIEQRCERYTKLRLQTLQQAEHIARIDHRQVCKPDEQCGDRRSSVPACRSALNSTTAVRIAKQLHALGCVVRNFCMASGSTSCYIKATAAGVKFRVRIADHHGKRKNGTCFYVRTDDPNAGTRMSLVEYIYRLIVSEQPS